MGSLINEYSLYPTCSRFAKDAGEMCILALEYIVYVCMFESNQELVELADIES
jgi:hypothetical protein